MSSERDSSGGAVPGDMLVALKHMRAWETEKARGNSEVMTRPGDQALVLQCWQVAGHTRLLVLLNHDATRLCFFSSRTDNFWRNWELLERLRARMKREPNLLEPYHGQL